MLTIWFDERFRGRSIIQIQLRARSGAFLYSAFHKKLKIPFCRINNPKIKRIIAGTETIIDVRKIVPHKKSTQLAKSFKNPSEDLANKISPKIINA